VRTLLDKEDPAGTKVRLEVSSVQLSSNFTIDLADLELVAPPLPAPANSISVLDFNADPTGVSESTTAFEKAVKAGEELKKIVYIPPGTYLLYDRITVDQVHVQGAGYWYSVLTGMSYRLTTLTTHTTKPNIGRHPTDIDRAVGFMGIDGSKGCSRDVVLSHFAIMGNINERRDVCCDEKGTYTNGVGGAMSDSVIDNLWIQHMRCGLSGDAGVECTFETGMHIKERENVPSLIQCIPFARETLKWVSVSD